MAVIQEIYANTNGQFIGFYEHACC